ncbi:hypothetical protein BX600DRAFT_121422 [Xylariales sp. PMI_506]|nr:hypothetical protein BX600DRAFT_121422 [Xylariales sp. PMI_506]
MGSAYRVYTGALHNTRNSGKAMVRPWDQLKPLSSPLHPPHFFSINNRIFLKDAEKEKVHATHKRKRATGERIGDFLSLNGSGDGSAQLAPALRALGQVLKIGLKLGKQCKDSDLTRSYRYCSGPAAPRHAVTIAPLLRAKTTNLGPPSSYIPAPFIFS